MVLKINKFFSNLKLKSRYWNKLNQWINVIESEFKNENNEEFESLKFRIIEAYQYIYSAIILTAFFGYLIPLISEISEFDSKNLFKENDKVNLYVFLTESNNFYGNRNSSQLIWEVHDINFGYLGLIYNDELRLKCECNLNKDAFICNCDPDQEYFLYSKYRPIKNKNFLNSLISVYNFTKNDEWYLHVFIAKSDVFEFDSNSDNIEILNRFKKINLKNWVSNYTINLIDHRENVNQIDGTMFGKLINYDLINGTYTPALSIEYNNDNNNDNNDDNNNDNNNVNNSRVILPLNFEFNQIDFCQFIVHSCEESSKNEQLRQICHEESFKLSTNFIYFIFIENKSYRLSEKNLFNLSQIITYYLSFLFLLYFWFKDYLPVSYNLFLFNLFKSIVFILYELNRTPYQKCNYYNNNNFFIFASSPAIIFWILYFLFNLKDLLNKKASYYPTRTFSDVKQLEEHDWLTFKYLSIIMLPLFIFYSYYSFHNYYHKNYYHLIINILYGYLLNFGFLMIASEIYMLYKVRHFKIVVNWEYIFIIFFKLLFIFYEDLIDYQYKYREPLKLFYLRDELFYFICLILVYRINKNREERRIK